VMMADKEIGSARHALMSTYSVNCHDLRLPLVTPKGKSAGELQLVLSFKPHLATAPSPAVMQPAHMAAPGLALMATAPGPQVPQRPTLYPQVYQGPNL
jgi:hypothetical protein